MKYEGIYTTLLGVLNPLSLRILLLLHERPHTRMEMYEACSKWNNTIVKSAMDTLGNNNLVNGGSTRGDAYRLTIKGAGLAEWLVEGGLVI